jgi:nucleoside-diphosphate-sugar epimerase
MKVLVTGGSGFIGTNLVQQLVERKLDVINVDICAPRVEAHLPLWREVSILDRDAMLQLLEDARPDYVIHGAARTDLDGEGSEDYAVNTKGTSNLIDALAAAGSVKRAIFISSMLVCRNGYTPSDDLEFCPDTPYGESKVQMETIVRERMGEAGIEYVIVRPTSVWGPWFSEPYLQFFLTVRRGLYVHPGRVQVKKQFAYVGNVVDQITKLLTASAQDCSGSVFYVGDYSAYNVREWADMIQEELEAARIHSVPLPVLRAVAAVGDVLVSLGWRRVPLTRFRLSNMLTNNLLPFEKTSKVCGPLRYSVAEGVRQTVAWLEKQGI